jgi:hypothetical protein
MALKPEQERRVIDALIELDPAERLESLVGESLGTIQHLCDCSAAEAQAILNDLQTNRLIETDITPRGGPVHDRIPVGRLRWVRP